MQRYIAAAVALVMLALAWVGVSFIRSGKPISLDNLIAALPRQLGGKGGVGVSAPSGGAALSDKGPPAAGSWVLFNTPDSRTGAAVWHARMSAPPDPPTAAGVASLELGHAQQSIFPTVLTVPGASAACPAATRVTLQLDSSPPVTFKAAGARNRVDCVLAVQTDEIFDVRILNADRLTVTAEMMKRPVVFTVSGLSWPPS